MIDIGLRVYNTGSGSLEEFKPNEEGQVKVYICGLTVYDFMHVGHARTYIAFDVVLRYLKYKGFSVRYVQNITDIDDKIIKRARERNVSPLELSGEFAVKSLEDQEKLGLLKADVYPKVSEHIQDIIDAVKILVEKGSAYVVEGNVFFDVSTFTDYGRLSNQDTEHLKRHRIEPNPKKRNPLDFALWKKSGESELGFESPWGFGRPGWHIECSVMSQKHLGSRLDIHGGALDLVFPHHENEIAQSETLTGVKPFVKYWMHTGFLYSSGMKMSKSLGNILSVRDFLEKYSRDAFRLFVLQTHYRSQVDYNLEKVSSSEKAVERLANFKNILQDALGNASLHGKNRAVEVSKKLKEGFIESMDDDFNTPRALAVLFEAVRELNTVVDEGGESKKSLEESLKIFDEVTGILGLDLKLNEKKIVELNSMEKELVEERNRLRSERKWVEADEIRNELLSRGIVLVDRKDGTTGIERA